MKLYSSDTDASPNGAAPPDPDEPELDEQYDFSTLFDAPSYSDFIKTAPNSQARSYERRVQSMMKAGMVMSLNNQQWADAATFLKHGPGFAKAAGNLAATDANAAKIVDMLTAPDSPYVMFVMVAIPMVSQLFRNHQPELRDVNASWKQRRAKRKQAKLSGAKPPITVHLFRREIKLPIRFNVRMPRLQNLFKAFLAPTQHPGLIAQEVFRDQSVIKALHKMGIYPREAPHDES